MDLPGTTRAVVRRITEALHLADREGLPGNSLPTGGWTRLLVDPIGLRVHLERSAGGRIRVAGTLERRLLFAERLDGSWVAADLSGRPHATRAWPIWTGGNLEIEDPASWLSPASLNAEAVLRLSRPTVLLAALYHPENFPLPRFALGIHDVARAARTSLLGTVTLADMQLGTTREDLVARIGSRTPDILGVGATFGQHDLMIELLDAAHAFPHPPTVIVGGSLTARNEDMLLKRYPSLLVARGRGEATIEGLLAHWHGDLEREQIPGLGYIGAARGGGLTIARRHTAKPQERDATADMLPELDLLPETFERHGVAQAESSRGCTNFCSFCPRGHKGTWAGARPGGLPSLLREMRRIFDLYPGISRTLYLVDEEFIGRGTDAAPRALEVARLLHEAGFAWESSCRIDQVVHPGRDRDWHLERARMWRGLTGRGLRRMLFGVESGVDSVLARFAKETTGEQNALAIRTLSALGIPTRYTYITFDQLMSLQELKETFAFQGRTDLLLCPQPGLTVEEIVDGVRDESFVACASTGQPLYAGISYMLVSMECLIGAAYTRRAQAAGLTGRERPSMGRVDARFADWRIGSASTFAQLWVDRNFAFDYTLKSLEKLLDGEDRRTVRATRLVLKGAAYEVLGEMIAAAENSPLQAGPADEGVLAAILRDVLDLRFDTLREQMSGTVDEVCELLHGEHAATLRREHGRWESAAGWQLINPADPLGTYTEVR